MSEQWPGTPIEAKWSGSPIGETQPPPQEKSDGKAGLTQEPAGFFKSMARGFGRSAMDFLTSQGEAESIAMGQEPGPKPQGGPPRATTPGGKFGEAIGEFVGNPLSYLGPGGLGFKAVSALTGAVGSEAAGQLTEGSKAEPYSRIIGAVLGGAVPRTAVRAVTPLPASAERMQYVNQLRAEGIESTAGQITGSRALKVAESALGDAPGAGGAASAAKERIGEQFTRAALRRIGEDADRATPEVIDRALTRNGNDFDAMASRNDAQLDRQYLLDILQARHEYDHLFVDPMRAPIVDNVIDHAINQLQRSGTMRGAQYKALRSRIERTRRGSRDPEINMFLADVRDAMDELMERNIAANNPADLGAWRDTRNQYRNLLVFDVAATGAGEEAAGGIVSPAKLRQATVAKHGRREYARGRGDFAELARAAERIIQYPGTSGTSERQLALGLPASLATGFTPGLIGGRAVMSGPMQAYLGNQIAAGLLGRLSPARYQALRSAIVAEESSPHTIPGLVQTLGQQE